MKNKFLFAILFSFLILPLSVQSQGFAWGVKGGLTIGQQKWDASFDRQLLFKYHGIVFIESLAENESVSLFAQAGYHLRGSAVRYRYFTAGGGDVTYKREFKFENLGLTVGGKKRSPLGPKSAWYYLMGLRGEYSLKNNLNDVFFSAGDCEQIYLPYDNGSTVRKFLFGAAVGGGFEFHFAELVGCLIELTVNPDFSRQYDQPPIPNVINTCSWNGSVGQNLSIPQRQIKNTSLEISVGLRLLRKVEYVD